MGGEDFIIIIPKAPNGLNQNQGHTCARLWMLGAVQTHSKKTTLKSLQSKQTKGAGRGCDLSEQGGIKRAVSEPGGEASSPECQGSTLSIRWPCLSNSVQLLLRLCAAAQWEMKAMLGAGNLPRFSRSLSLNHFPATVRAWDTGLSYYSLLVGCNTLVCKSWVAWVVCDVQGGQTGWWSRLVSNSMIHLIRGKK